MFPRGTCCSLTDERDFVDRRSNIFHIWMPLTLLRAAQVVGDVQRGKNEDEKVQEDDGKAYNRQNNQDVEKNSRHGQTMSCEREW